MQSCECGCGSEVTGTGRHGQPRRFVNGHNFRGKTRSAANRAAIGEGQRRAWSTKRKRMPLGSTNIDVNGYVRVKVVEGAGRWLPQHVLVMEEHLGHKLPEGAIVHHINGDRQDNRIENLYLCRDHSHHAAVHNSQDAALRTLLAAGWVVFRDGHYEAAIGGPKGG